MAGCDTVHALLLFRAGLRGGWVGTDGAVPLLVCIYLHSIIQARVCCCRWPQVVVLGRGRLMYCGSPAGVLPWFEGRLGYAYDPQVSAPPTTTTTVRYSLGPSGPLCHCDTIDALNEHTWPHFRQRPCATHSLCGRRLYHIASHDDCWSVGTVCWLGLTRADQGPDARAVSVPGP